MAKALFTALHTDFYDDGTSLRRESHVDFRRNPIGHNWSVEDGKVMLISPKHGHKGVAHVCIQDAYRQMMLRAITEDP